MSKSNVTATLRWVETNPKTNRMNTQENKTVQILARHDFTDSEIRGIAVKMAGVAQSYSATESEFASVKQDFKAKLDRLELDRDTLVQRIRDGFEMRPTPAYVEFNVPEKGRKRYYRVGQGVYVYGEMIREEPMDATDFQRELPLEEPEKNGFGGVEEEADSNKENWRGDDGESLDPDRFPETGDSSAEIREAREVIETAAEKIGTSIGEKLAEAAQGKAPNPVVIDFLCKDDGNKCLARWRRAARNQGWPEPCIDLIDGIAKDAHGKQAILAVLGAHSISKDAEDSILLRLETYLPLAGKSEQLTRKEWVRVYGYTSESLAINGAKLVPISAKDASEKLADTFSGANKEDGQ